MAEAETFAGLSLSAEENSFFETGGETAIPSEAGSDNAGGVTSETGSGDPGGGNKSADQGNKAPQTVPLAALQEERTKRKAASENLRKLETELAEMRGKFSILDRLNAKPGEGEGQGDGAAPKPEDDIFGAVNAISKRLDDDAKAKADADKKAADDKKASDEQTTFVTNYRSDAAQFEAKNADYRAAYNHLLGSRATELIAIGYDDPKAVQAAGGTPQEVHAAAKALHDAIVADEAAIAQMAFSKGKSPAEMIYSLAKQRGYKKADAKPGEGEADKGKGAETLDRIERGQQASKSLNNAGGSTGDAEMTAERLMSMSLKDFETYAEKNPAKVKRLMGG